MTGRPGTTPVSPESFDGSGSGGLAG